MAWNLRGAWRSHSPGVQQGMAMAYALVVAFEPPAAPVVVGLDPDAADLARFRAGDGLAFERLVSRREREVFNLAWRMLGSRDDALDATQETFLRVFRSLPGFRAEATFRTWVFGIALNVCRNQLASAATRARRQSLRLVGDDPGEEPAPVISDPRPGPEALAKGRELRQALEAALARLSEEHREILLLRELEGLDYVELARVLACAPGTVKSRLARARAALREELEGVWP
ncbi:MAG: sigma-70 family RNA polymerase sigma factor [Acidobacteriota bacterium]